MYNILYFDIFCQDLKKLVKFEEVSYDIFTLMHSEKLDTMTSKIRGGFFTNSLTQTNENINNADCNTEKIITETKGIQAPGDLCETKIISKEDFDKYDDSQKLKLVKSLEVYIYSLLFLLFLSSSLPFNYLLLLFF